jgi:hypothetical protein
MSEIIVTNSDDPINLLTAQIGQIKDQGKENSKYNSDDIKVQGFSKDMKLYQKPVEEFLNYKSSCFKQISNLLFLFAFIYMILIGLKML